MLAPGRERLPRQPESRLRSYPAHLPRFFRYWYGATRSSREPVSGATSSRLMNESHRLGRDAPHRRRIYGRRARPTQFGISRYRRHDWILSTARLEAPEEGGLAHGERRAPCLLPACKRLESGLRQSCARSRLQQGISPQCTRRKRRDRVWRANSALGGQYLCEADECGAQGPTAPLGCLLGFALRHRRRSERQPYRDHESGGSQQAIETAFGLNGRDALYQMPGSNRYCTLVK